MPLQNRVDPFGDLIATPAFGLFMGNRGGRIHTDEQTLTSRRWASRQWICCVLDFKGRQRDVWGRYYTELFFLDEPTALAAGHRPCFECRRKDAERFSELFDGRGKRASADAMDRRLHAERLNGNDKRIHQLPFAGLPDGAFVTIDGEAYAVRGKRLLLWTPNGYTRAIVRPRGTANVLTPPSILKVLKAGYRPRWHTSAVDIVRPPRWEFMPPRLTGSVGEVLFWTWAVIAGFLHGAAVFVTAYFTVHGPWTWWNVSLGIGAVLIFATTGFGHVVFLAVFLRRLERAGARLTVPKAIARFLARLFGSAQI
jgi:hypothetical protein